MKAAIFGVGFIGTATGNRLVHNGWDVVGFDDGMIERESEVEFPVGHGDVCNPGHIGDFLRHHRPEVIFWFPARQGYGFDHSDFARVQLLGTYSLFEALDKIPWGDTPKRIVLASSQAIYDPGVNVKEDRNQFPPSVYGWSKHQQEEAFHWFCMTRRYIDCVALRYSIVLGPGQALQSTESGLLRNWYRKWKAGEAPEIYGVGTQLRDFVHVEDVAEANILAATCEDAPSAFNIGGNSASISDMAKWFMEMTDCVTPVVLGTSQRPGGEYSMVSCSQYAKAVLGWESKHAPAVCMRDFLDSAKRKDQTGRD